jgi:hypothetical protein
MKRKKMTLIKKISCTCVLAASIASIFPSAGWTMENERPVLSLNMMRSTEEITTTTKVTRALDTFVGSRAHIQRIFDGTNFSLVSKKLTDPSEYKDFPRLLDIFKTSQNLIPFSYNFDSEGRIIYSIIESLKEILSTTESSTRIQRYEAFVQEYLSESEERVKFFQELSMPFNEILKEATPKSLLTIVKESQRGFEIVDEALLKLLTKNLEDHSYSEKEMQEVLSVLNKECEKMSKLIKCYEKIEDGDE